LLFVQNAVMQARQTILKWFYPIIMQTGKILPNKKNIIYNQGLVEPYVSFYKLSATLFNGNDFSFQQLQGKKVLIVNTASFCGFTAQYAELEKLYSLYHTELEILAFPANDFKEQEPDDNATIATFCSINYGVDFPLMQKTVVVPSAMQHPVYQWLTQPQQNGWNQQPPVWNFNKYLVNEKGVLTHYFSSFVSPLSNAMKTAISL